MIAGLPYDAEVEYLESTGTQYIDTGIYGTLDTVAKFRACATAADAFYPIFGARDSYRSNAFAVYNGSDVGYKYTISFDNVFSAIYVVSNTLASVGDWVDFELGIVPKIGSWSVNLANINPTQFTTRNPMLLFAWNQNGTIAYGKYKVSYLQIYSNGVLVRDMIPVRVGMEGAMYDRVSRKLFRIAGIGAFTIGPDVAVPVMGLHFMRRPRHTAKDYVQDGLVAMWDGIENAGWGTHDAGTTTWRELVGGRDLAVSSGIFGGDGLYGTDSTACQATFADASYSLKDVMAADVATTIGCTLEFVCTPLGYSNTPYNMYSAWSIYSIGGNPPPLWSWYRCNTWVNNISTRGSIGQPISFSGASTPQTPYPSFQLYSNGEFVNRGAYTPQTGSISDTFMVGLKGAVHSIRVYSRALTAAEIAHNHAVDKERFSLT